jgi:hypothetical protein
MTVSHVDHMEMIICKAESDGHRGSCGQDHRGSITQSNHRPTSGSSLDTLATQNNHSPTSGKLVSHLSEARATTGQSY